MKTVTAPIAAHRVRVGDYVEVEHHALDGGEVVAVELHDLIGMVTLTVLPPKPFRRKRLVFDHYELVDVRLED